MTAGDASLAGKRILVVGGSAGIGRGIVVAAAAVGAAVVVVGRDAAKLDDVAGSHAAIHPIKADIGDPARCREVVTEAVRLLGGLDALVISSAISSLSTLDEETVEQWQTLMAVNVVAPTRLTAAALEHLSEGGVVVYLSSTGSTVELGNHPGLGAYAASKAALNRSIQAWRVEHPERRFVCMKIGDTGGTDVSRDFDWERARELFGRWLKVGLVSGATMDPGDLGQTIVEVTGTLLRHPGLTMPELVITPVGPPMDPEQMAELMASALSASA